MLIFNTMTEKRTVANDYRYSIDIVLVVIDHVTDQLIATIVGL